MGIFLEYSILIINMLKTIVLKNFTNKKKYKIGSTLVVTRGYGRYLINNSYVLPDTDCNREIANSIIEEEKFKKNNKILKANEIKESLEKEVISFIITNCNGNGILFGAISVKDIINKLNILNKSLYNSIKPNEVHLKNIIKTYGIYQCSIFLYEDIETVLNIYVGNSREHIDKLVGNNINDNNETK